MLKFCTWHGEAAAALAKTDCLLTGNLSPAFCAYKQSLCSYILSLLPNNCYHCQRRKKPSQSLSEFTSPCTTSTASATTTCPSWLPVCNASSCPAGFSSADCNDRSSEHCSYENRISNASQD